MTGIVSENMLHPTMPVAAIMESAVGISYFKRNSPAHSAIPRVTFTRIISDPFKS